MARDLVLDVIAKKNSRELSQLADEFDKVAKKAEHAGDGFKRTGSFSQMLDEEISKTKVHVRELGEEFDRTGNKDVFGKLKGAQSNLRSLEGIKKSLAASLEDGAKDAAPKVGEEIKKTVTRTVTRGAKDAAPDLGEILSGGISRSQVGPALAITIAAASPAIGAATAAAVLTGIGLAGIGGAVAVQLREPAVIEAGSALGHRVLEGLTQATDSFRPVLLRVIDQAGGAFDRLQPALTKMFDGLAGPAERLGDGLVNMIERAMPGIMKAADAAGPLIDELAQDAPLIGDALGEFASDMAEVGPQAKQFLYDTVTGISNLVEFTGELTANLAKAYGFLKEWDPYVKLLSPNDNVRAYAKSLEDVGTAGHKAAGGIEDVDAAAKKFHDSVIAAEDATLGAKQATLDFADALKENGRHWDDNTRAGLANRQALDAAVAAKARAKDANIAAGMSAEQAAAQYNKEVEQLLELAKKAGLSKQELDRLKGIYEVQVITKFGSVGSQNAGTKIKGGNPKLIAKEAGGPVEAHRAYLVGEKRPELFIPNTNGTIIPEVPSRSNPTPWGGGGAPAAMRHEFVFAGGGLGAAIERELREGRLIIKSQYVTA